MTTKEIRKILDDYPRILARAERVVSLYHGESPCSHYVTRLETGFMRVVIHYVETYYDGVPSSSYSEQLRLEVPEDLLNPDWESEHIREEVNRLKDIMSPKHEKSDGGDDD